MRIRPEIRLDEDVTQGQEGAAFVRETWAQAFALTPQQRPVPLWRRRDMHMLIVAMSLAVVVPIQAQVFPPPAEMSIAVRAAQDPSLDDAGRQKLLGKDYAGLITVRAVRLRPDGSAVVEADLPQPTAGRPAIRLRFTTTEDNQLVQTLRPDQSLRIRATLTRFAGTPPAPVLEFSGFDPSSQR